MRERCPYQQVKGIKDAVARQPIAQKHVRAESLGSCAIQSVITVYLVKTNKSTFD